MVFEVVTSFRQLVRLNGGDSCGFSLEDISKSGRFVSLGVADGNDELDSEREWRRRGRLYY